MSLSTLLGKIHPPQQKKKQEIVIPLIREPEKEVPKDKRIVIKLRSTPGDANSQLYEVVTRAFDHGTPEEWIRHRKIITKILEGQNITNGPDLFRMTRRLLEGKALADFEASIVTNQYTESVANLKLALRDVAVPIFPTRALQKQRRSMRRKMPKPLSMPVAQYWARLVQLNEFLPFFPDGDDTSKLEEDDLKEVLEFGIPETWRMHMTITRFISANEKPASIVNFCRELEGIEQEHGSLDVIGTFKKSPKKTPKTPSFAKKPDPPVSTPRRGQKKRSRSNFEELDDSGPCPIHPDLPHTAKQCKKLQKMIKEERNNYAKRNKSNSPKKVSFKPKPTSQQELQVMIEDYLQSCIFPPRKPVRKRHLKWTKPKSKYCCISKNPVSETVIPETPSKPDPKAKLDSDIVQKELQQFNNFTIEDTPPSPNEEKLLKEILDEEDTGTDPEPMDEDTPKKS